MLFRHIGLLFFPDLDDGAMFAPGQSHQLPFPHQTNIEAAQFCPKVEILVVHQTRSANVEMAFLQVQKFRFEAISSYGNHGDLWLKVWWVYFFWRNHEVNEFEFTEMSDIRFERTHGHVKQTMWRWLPAPQFINLKHSSNMKESNVYWTYIHAGIQGVLVVMYFQCSAYYALRYISIKPCRNGLCSFVNV